MIKHLPDDVTIDEILSELYFKIQVDAGLQELDEGKGISYEKDKDYLNLNNHSISLLSIYITPVSNNNN